MAIQNNRPYTLDSLFSLFPQQQSNMALGHLLLPLWSSSFRPQQQSNMALGHLL